MLKTTLIKNVTLTATAVSVLGLSSFMDIKPSTASTITIPLDIDTFSLQGNTTIQPVPDNQFSFFTSDYIFINGSGSATSQPSPFLPLQSKQTFLHFDYVFSQNAGSTLQLFLNNLGTGTSTLVQSLDASAGGSASIDLSNLFVNPGQYSVTHQLSGGGSAGFNNFTLKISVPEPTNVLGLIALSAGAFAIKRRGKVTLIKN